MAAGGGGGGGWGGRRRRTTVRKVEAAVHGQIRPPSGKVGTHRGYSRGYGRPRGGVNAIKRASIRPSRRTSLISKSSASPCPAPPSSLPAATPAFPVPAIDFAKQGNVHRVLLRDQRGKFRLEMRVNVYAHECVEKSTLTIQRE